MKTKILKIQKSNRPIWETKLSIDGIISGKDNVPSTEQAYEMRVDFYDSESSDIPTKTVVIEEKYYANNIQKYGMEALLRGVEIDSLLSVAEESGNNSIDHFKHTAEILSHSIVARMEQDTFFNNYNPDSMREYIEHKILELRTKFKIEPR